MKILGILLTFVLQIEGAMTSKSRCPKSLTSDFLWHPYENHIARDPHGNMTGKLRGFLESAIQSCCPKMAAPRYTEIPLNDSKSMESLIRGADQDSKYLTIYFPVFADRNSLVRYERPFIALYDSPGIVVFVPATNEKMWNGFLDVATQLWQVITLAFLLAAISGILVWFLDRKANNGNFPKDFHHGSCAGLWWAFVTMSTVGYGDLVPRTFLSRIVSVLWMIVGYLTLAMFHANLTALITSKEIPVEISLVGKKIYIPRGGKAFLEQEFNLLAEYEELEYKDINLSRIFSHKEDMFLSYNYAELKLALQYRQTINNQETVKVLKNINHRFSVGISLSGNLTDSETFIMCLRKTLRDKVILHKYKTYKTLQKVLNRKPSSSSESSILLSSSSDHLWSVWMICIVSAGALLTLMIAVGMIHQVYHTRKYKLDGNSSKKSLHRTGKYHKAETDHKKNSSKC